MIVPVPAMLRPEDVRTLPHAVFDHVVKPAAPRLHEWAVPERRCIILSPSW